MSCYSIFIATGALTLFVAGGCKSQFESLAKQIEESRAPDTRSGVLSSELDPSSQARLELLGRTSAPTRYAERTDANRIRVVAFDFGGAKIGQEADAAGNLRSESCLDPAINPETFIEISPTVQGEPAPAAKQLPAGVEDLDLYKGMFRQYGAQVGTTIDAELGIGPVGGSTHVYFSHNFLVMEWRRYQLERLRSPALCRVPHVSAVERGIAVRIVFDVRLRTVDAKLSASFGIADLAVALARSEATVETSYEVVGTSLDLLPSNAIIITSLNEYIEALKRFHEAVATISDAWSQYNSIAPKGDKTGESKIVVKRGDKSEDYSRRRLFVPDQLAYYVSGDGLGDIFLHLENAELCHDRDAMSTYYNDKISSLGAEMSTKLAMISADGKAEQKDKLDRGEVRELRTRVTELRRQIDMYQKMADAAEFSKVENDCKRTLRHERLRVADACLYANSPKKGGAAASVTYYGPFSCADVEDEVKDIKKERKEQENQQKQEQKQQQQQQQQK